MDSVEGLKASAADEAARAGGDAAAIGVGRRARAARRAGEGEQGPARSTGTEEACEGMHRELARIKAEYDALAEHACLGLGHVQRGGGGVLGFYIYHTVRALCADSTPRKKNLVSPRRRFPVAASARARARSVRLRERSRGVHAAASRERCTFSSLRAHTSPRTRRARATSEAPPLRPSQRTRARPCRPLRARRREGSVARARARAARRPAAPGSRPGP